MTASKLTMLELRSQEQRSDTQDVGRGLTNYLLEKVEQKTKDYMCSGVKRKFDSWRESRLINQDVPSVRFQESWMKIKKMGFDHANNQLEEWKVDHLKANYMEEVGNMELQVEKLKMVFDNPTEQF